MHIRGPSGGRERWVRALRAAGRMFEALDVVRDTEREISSCLESVMQYIHHGCRTRHAIMQVQRAEIAAAVGRRDEARTHLDKLHGLWPRANDEMALRARARRVEEGLRP